MKNQEKEFVDMFGQTDPEPVLEKQRVFDKSFEETFRRVKAELKSQIESEKRMNSVKKFNDNVKKKTKLVDF